MGRKRNQGKARKAAKAKAKAKREAEERENDNGQTTANEGEEQLTAAQMQRVQSGDAKCLHGVDPHGADRKNSSPFMTAFYKSFDEARGSDTSFEVCLIVARDATMDEFSEVWNDSAKMESVMRCLLFFGTQAILKGDDKNAKTAATSARYFEEHIAVVLKETQALYRWNKILETQDADLHSLVNFFRHRIPCSCLDEKYEEVKDIPKMGICFSSQCTLPNGRVEYSKTMYCDRCRSVTYCSRECQIADWKEHKDECGIFADQISEFEATKQA
mmetsp:Transcript_9475/g.14470  ORF Transcript_9475/g.14470 Transcript_9475/m.14470 type:complete len:273 (-) Transcript_9475:62-880(-)